MKTDSYTKIIQKGFISSELELEKATMFERKLRLMAQENPDFTAPRNQLRTLIKDYEKSNWSSRSNITENQIAESGMQQMQMEGGDFDMEMAGMEAEEIIM